MTGHAIPASMLENDVVLTPEAARKVVEIITGVPPIEGETLDAYYARSGMKFDSKLQDANTAEPAEQGFDNKP